jgi:hypothetical protein
VTDTLSPSRPGSAACRASMALALVVAAASFVLAVLLTRTAWFRDAGEWHLRAVAAAAVLFPAAILLFAFGVQWAARGRPLAGLVAMAPLPAWVIGMHLTRIEMPANAAPGVEGTLVNAHLLVNDAWFALLMLQMQGVQPFGGA